MNECYFNHGKIIFLMAENLNAYRTFVYTHRLFEDCFFVRAHYDEDANNQSNYKGYKIISFGEFYANAKAFQSEDYKLIIFERDISRLEELLEKLDSIGYKCFRDYVPDEFFINPSIVRFDQDFGKIYYRDLDYLKIFSNRKLCFINGNCQTEFLKECLISNKGFSAVYCIIDFGEICNIDRIKFEIDIDYVINAADLILTQPVRENNKFSEKLSQQYIFKAKNNGARVISISLLNFCGYFPQYTSKSKLLSVGEKLIPYGDKNVDLLISNNINKATIIKELNKTDYYNLPYIHHFIKEELDRFAEREQDVDVKMGDYIKLNYSKEILFHSFNHPKWFVIKELATRILKYLGFTDIELNDEFWLEKKSKMHFQEQPVYPSVLKILGMDNSNRFYSTNALTGWHRLSFSEYIEYYIDCMSVNVSSYSAKYISSGVSVNIWGSCVSREIFNYLPDVKVNTYILQNPIHTMYYKPVSMDESFVKATSDFSKRMLLHEIHKDAYIEFESKKSDYLVIDTCDCRLNYWVDKNDPDIRICSSPSSDMTINEVSNGEYEFIKNSIFSITEDEWKSYVDKFCAYILTLYDADRIILNRFRFANFFCKDGEMFEYKENAYYEKVGLLTAKIEDMIIGRIPRIQVLDFPHNILGDYYHHLGQSTMHYTDEVYLNLADKLCKIFSDKE